MKVLRCVFLQGQVMFRNGERMGTIKFTQFQGKSIRWSFLMVKSLFIGHAGSNIGPSAKVDHHPSYMNISRRDTVIS